MFSWVNTNWLYRNLAAASNLFHPVGPFLILTEGQAEDVRPLAANSWSRLVSSRLTLALLGNQQGYSLEKVGTVDSLQHSKLSAHTIAPGIPIISQGETVRRKRSGPQFEHVEVTPPVLTFSNTVHTASLEVYLSRLMTGSW